jgi:hypothetical protein
MAEIIRTQHEEGAAVAPANTNVAALNVSRWARRYVKIWCRTQDFDFRWGALDTLSTPSIATGACGTSGTTVTGDATKCDSVLKDDTRGEPIWIDPDLPILHYKMVTGTGGVLHIIPTSEKA